MKAVLAALLAVVALAIGALFFFSQSEHRDFSGENDKGAVVEDDSEDLESDSASDDARRDEDGAREDGGAPPDDAAPSDSEAALTLRGRLIDDAGRPVANCKIDLGYRNSGVPLMLFRISNAKLKKVALRAVSGKDGRFTFALPETQAGALVLDSDDWIFPKDVSFTRSLEDIDLGDLSCVKAATIHGSVHGGVPIAKGTLSLQQTRDNRYRNETIATGKFTIRRLVPGPYSLTVNAPKHLGLKQLLDLSPGQELHGLDIRLSLGLPLRGRVVDDTGAAVAGAHINAYSVKQWKIKEGSFVHASAQSDANGNFTLDGVDEDELQVNASKSNYKGANIRTKRAKAPLLLTLHRQASIAGSLLDAKGRPIKGSRVVAKILVAGKKRDEARMEYSIVSGNGQSYMSYGSAASHSKTKKDGSFRLTGLKPGDYVVIASGEHLDVESKPIHLELGIEHKGVSLVAQAGVEAQVTVLDPRGRPVKNAKVEAELASDRDARIKKTKAKPSASTANRLAGIRSADLSPIRGFAGPAARRKVRASSKTDENGIAIVRGLRGETGYYFTASARTIVTTTSALVETGTSPMVKTTLRSARGGFIVVHAVDAWGKPAPKTSFQIRPLDPETTEASSRAPASLSSSFLVPSRVETGGKTDANGRAKLGPLAPGKYEAVFLKQTGSTSYWVSGTSTKKGEGVPFEIQSGETSEVELRAPATITIQGSLTENGQPIAHEQVHLMFDRRAGNQRRGGWAGSAKTDGNGEFVLQGIEAGAYFLQFEDAANYDKSALRVQVQEAPATQRHNIALLSRRTKLRVLDAKAGKPIAGAQVLPRQEAARSGLERMLYISHDFGGKKTDARGEYEFGAGSSSTMCALIQAKGYASKIIKLPASASIVEVRLEKGASLKIVEASGERSLLKLRKKPNEQGISVWASSSREIRIAAGTYEYRFRSWTKTSGTKASPWSPWKPLIIREGENELRLGN